MTAECLIGGIIAMVFGAAYADEQVRAETFCENCEQYMKHSRIKELTYSDTKAAAEILAGGDLQAVAKLTHDAEVGAEGMIDLHSCPDCRDGILELSGHVVGSWQEGNETKTMNTTWLVQSATVTEREALWFRGS